MGCILSPGILLATRLVTAAVAIPIITIIVLLGGLWLTVPLAVVAGIGAFEAATIFKLGRGRAIAAAIPSTALVALGSYMSATNQEPGFVSYFISVAAILALVGLVLNGRIPLPFRKPITMLSAAFYAGGLLFHAPMLRGFEDGLSWVVLLVVVSFANDTAAFFGGRALGRRPLAPVLSPSKTQEGALFGIAGAVVASVICVNLFSLDASLLQAVALGAMVGVASQIGDLAESRMKRLGDVKDSGRLVPGHGGVLDRLDAIVVSTIVVYYFVLWSVY